MHRLWITGEDVGPKISDFCALLIARYRPKPTAKGGKSQRNFGTICTQYEKNIMPIYQYMSRIDLYFIPTPPLFTGLKYLATFNQINQLSLDHLFAILR